jgi:hypothetical protein
MLACRKRISTIRGRYHLENDNATGWYPMTEQNSYSEDLDAWRSERKLDRMRAPARHAVAAWALAAALALVAVLGPPATRQVVGSLIELRHEVLMLDRELDRASVRFVALGSDQIERLDQQLRHGD